MARKRKEVPAISAKLSEADLGLGDARLNRRLGLLADQADLLADRYPGTARHRTSPSRARPRRSPPTCSSHQGTGTGTRSSDCISAATALQ